MAGQRHLMTKHRRIVSDTSAYHLPMSVMLQRQQQQGPLTPPVTVSHQDDPLYRYV